MPSVLCNDVIEIQSWRRVSVAHQDLQNRFLVESPVSLVPTAREKRC
jgi:hypothetical protein